MDFDNTKNIKKNCTQLVVNSLSAVRSTDPSSMLRNSVIPVYLFVGGLREKIGSWILKIWSRRGTVRAVVLKMCGSYWDLGSRKFMFISAWKRFNFFLKLKNGRHFNFMFLSFTSLVRHRWNEKIDSVELTSLHRVNLNLISIKSLDKFKPISLRYHLLNQ